MAPTTTRTQKSVEQRPSNSFMSFTADIQENICKMESKARKKILHYQTNPFIIYLCVIFLYHILKPIDYISLNPTMIITSKLIITIIDHIEIWIRFTLRMVKFYAFMLRKIIEYSTKFELFCTNMVNQIESRYNVNLWIIECLISGQLYFRIPILIAMNKTNEFTIKLQQVEIGLLQTKSQYLSEKNKWLTTHVSTNKKRRIKQHNHRVSRKLHKYLKNQLPTELINEIYEFSYVKYPKSDEIKMNLMSKQELVLKAASKMNYKWIWKRYQFVKMHRNINIFECLCWLIIYYWFRTKYQIKGTFNQMMQKFCKLTKISQHTIWIICQQFITLFLTYFLVKTF